MFIRITHIINGEVNGGGVLVTEVQIDQLIAAVAKVRSIPRENVSLDSPLVDLGFDSLDTTVLLFDLEKLFNISIPDDDVRSVRTVNDIVVGIDGIFAKGNSGTLPTEASA